MPVIGEEDTKGMDDILRDLERLRRYGSGLQSLLSELQRMAPQRSEGTDPTGMVRAVLGPDGQPETIRVSSYWKDKLQPASFAEAVTAACMAAVQQRGAEWSETLQRLHWQERLERLDADTSTPAGPAPAGQIPSAFRRANGTPPRPVDQYAEDVISVLDAALSSEPPAQPPAGAGTNRGSTLEIRLGPGGRLACRADQSWVARQSGVQLSEALSTALTAARRQLAAAEAAAAASTQALTVRTDRLMTEIFGSYGDPSQ